MKKKNSILKYYIIGSIVFVLLIVILANGNKPAYTNPLNYNMLRIPNIINRNSKDFDEIKTYVTIKLEDYGYDIYVPSGSGYRYGPSIIKYDDGTMDAWFASNGNNSTEWDYITYRHFDGSDWGSEEIVLKPTKGSKDHYSTCDPGVIYFGGYYYIGYTSTENATGGGVENCGYVARSENPDGPFEKWSGDHWGDDPEPIFVYDEDDLGWGAGEISFVIVDSKIYCYYTWISKKEVSTRLAIGSIDDDWPATLDEQGVAIERKGNQGSVDVIYVEEYDKFLALCIEDNFGANSCIGVYESKDGLSFSQVDSVNGINKFAHNMGISKSPIGHVSIDDDLLVGYAYSKGNRSTWGRWATKLQSAKVKLVRDK